MTKTAAGDQRTLNSMLGNLPLRSRQAERLGVGQGQPLRPELEQRWLRASAKVSDAEAATASAPRRNSAECKGTKFLNP